MRQAPSIGGLLELCHWAKSSGHNRLSRLSAKGVKRALISWLLCWVEERSDQLVTVLSWRALWSVGYCAQCCDFLYLLALILTTSVTYRISKSLCEVWLETYQVALLIILSIFDRNIWRILVSDGLLHPHSSIPYVQMGRSIAWSNIMWRTDSMGTAVA